MKKGRWKDKWNKNRNKKSGLFLSRLLVPLFCMCFLLGGCSGEELANVDWEAVESELAALEEELLVLEEGAYEEQYEEFVESTESGKSEDGGKTDAEEVKSSAETGKEKSESDSSEAQEASENSGKQDTEAVKSTAESSENKATEDAKKDADAYEKTYEVVDEPVENNSNLNAPIDKEGSYTTVEDVSLYLYTYDELPDNFITKEEARELGWEGGSLEPYAPGMCIGGDYFGNREGLLPKEKGRDYYECDIDTLGAKSRGAKRIVYSDDGLIYYTDDHYESFTLLYGEE